MSKKKKTKRKVLPPQKGKTYVQRMSDKEKQWRDCGFLEGEQLVIDMMECVLHDKNIMGSDAFGEQRMLRIIHAIADRTDYYWPAFCAGNMADVRQEELDKELGEIHKDKLVKFADRHPYVVQFGYDEARKGWVDE